MAVDLEGSGRGRFADNQNAGVDLLARKSIEESDMDKFRAILNTNIMSGVLCTQQAFFLMGSQSPKGGRIINNGSISATAPRPSQSSFYDNRLADPADAFAYTISKHGVAGLTKSTSLDGRKHNISATQLDIGNASSAMADHLSSGAMQADGSMKPEPVMPNTNVGKAICFLSSLDPRADVTHLEIL